MKMMPFLKLYALLFVNAFTHPTDVAVLDKEKGRIVKRISVAERKKMKTSELQALGLA